MTAIHTARCIEITLRINTAPGEVLADPTFAALSWIEDGTAACADPEGCTALRASSVVTKAWNRNTQVFEAIHTEFVTGDEDLLHFELSAADLGCQVGDIFRMSVRDVDDVELYQIETVAR